MQRGGDEGRIGLQVQLVETEDNMQLSDTGKVRGMTGLGVGLHTPVGIRYRLQTNVETDIKWLQGLNE